MTKTELTYFPKKHQLKYLLQVHVIEEKQKENFV